jgi:phospholipid transport system transporter-binding protein
MVVAQGKGHFVLQGDLNRNSVPFCKHQTLTELSQFSQTSPDQKAILDMSGIAHTDTAGLAWLINLLRDCKQQNILVGLRNIPETLVNLAKISDVDSFLSVQ